MGGEIQELAVGLETSLRHTMHKIHLFSFAENEVPMFFSYDFSLLSVFLPSSSITHDRLFQLYPLLVSD